MSPLAAALMDRFGLRRVVSIALTLVALGAMGSTLMTASWQLIVFWGVLIGGGTGSMAMVLAATITNRWFATRKGLVMGVLTAGQAADQLVLYGLDWVATVPPTVALCQQHFGERSGIVFGWVFASHQIGAAAAAYGAGVVRDVFGEYTWAWWGGAAMCLIATVMSLLTKQRLTLQPTPQ